jgi:uncharacterized protein YcfL
MRKIFLIAVIALLMAGCGDSDERKTLLFNAWMKTHPGFNISQEEWQALRERKMLPGQANSTDNNVALGAALGVAAGMAIGPRKK